MLKKILEFFFGKNDGDNMPPTGAVKQTGLIVQEPKPGEWIGEETGIVGAIRMPNGDWTEYTPIGEKQYSILGFDTMSCSTFSALSIIETFVRFLISKNMLSEDHLTYLKLFGFIDVPGNINASDNFTAVMSGTTRNGNTLTNVLESVRTQGLVAERDFPFNTESFDRFHDKTRITPYLVLRAKKFLEFFQLNYQWVHFAQGRENTPAEILAMQNALKESPLHIGIVIPATHAEALIQFGGGQKTFYDSYEPFIKKFEDIYNPIHFSLKVVLTPKANPPKFPNPGKKFTSVLKLGMTSEDVKAYQKILCYFGFMNVSTGYFGPVTQLATKEFQKFYGLDPVGEVGPKTRELLNSMFNAPEIPKKTNGQILYETAVSCLKKDVTPNDNVSDDVACAESVNAVYKKAFGKEIGGGASTNLMYKALLSHPDFTKTRDVQPGDIVISPTGYGSNPNMPHGHVGIAGQHGSIMSNSSPTGLFLENYTQETWRQRYVNSGGYPMEFFRRK